MNPRTMTDSDLIEKYNKLVKKVKNTPKMVRRNTMPNQGNTRQVLLDEIQKRAMAGNSQLLEKLEH